jgi:acyl-CoA synthetase (AMP-forming)/AMP-acid ligase II
MDEEGYLYFVGRKDEMIKTSGYRVSPTEVEEVVYASGLVAEAVALGIPHPELGQAIVVVATPAPEHAKVTPERVLSECKRKLASYMVPETVLLRDSLPRNPNGKFDRGQLAAELRELFSPDGRAP